jgi:hypothetical protein
MHLLVVVALAVLLFGVGVMSLWRRIMAARQHHRRRRAPVAPPTPRHHRRNPAWARHEALKLMACLHSCRGVAEVFNRRHGPAVVIGKSWVSELCRAHPRLLAELVRERKRQPPRDLAVNAEWALDMTVVKTGRQRQTVLGLIDHGSRRLLALKTLPRKCTWTLLGHLCLAIAEHGKPRSVRTDNEGMFTSTLWAAGLRHPPPAHRAALPLAERLHRAAVRHAQAGVARSGVAVAGGAAAGAGRVHRVLQRGAPASEPGWAHADGGLAGADPRRCDAPGRSWRMGVGARWALVRVSASTMTARWVGV